MGDKVRTHDAPPNMPPVNLAVAGNDPFQWSISGEDLLAARNSFRIPFAVAEIGKPAHPNARFRWIAVMLLGFAVENLLKAEWLCQGNKAYDINGKMQFPDAFRSHNLVLMATNVGIAPDADLSKALDKLSLIMVGVGRYPFGTKPDPDRKEGYAHWTDEWDVQVEGLIVKLRETFKPC